MNQSNEEIPQYGGRTPIVVLKTTTKRENGRDAQLSNIKASKAVADIIRTSLGPKSMLKMILSQSGSIVMTNDGNAILRELNVAHPAAKSIIELSKTQDEEVGDGTTSVIIIAGEVLTLAEPFLMNKMHPRIIIRGFMKALDDSLNYLGTITKQVDLNNNAQLFEIIGSSIGTKFIAKWKDLMCDLSLQAIRIILDETDGRKEVDIRRYIQIEKIPGGDITDCSIVPGVMINKDITHSAMRRKIVNPRVILLDCNLEAQKDNNGGTIDIETAEEWKQAMDEEESVVRKMVDDIIKWKPDLVITEKGLSDEAQQMFVRNGITALRRLRKTINVRIARTTGATIVTRPEEIRESDIGTKCKLFSIDKYGDEYYTTILGETPKACTILLRGASKEILSEIERNLQDSLCVTRNVFLNPKLCPGGGASEMALSNYLREKSKTLPGVEQYPYHAVGIAMEVIPRTLIQNCGAEIVRTITNLRAQHADGKNYNFGVNGLTGEIVDMNVLGIWEPYSVKVQTIKTAIECACMLLKIDEIVSGLNKKGDKGDGSPKPTTPNPEDMDV
jgi:T-complex protein 1 subunit gamma